MPPFKDLTGQRFHRLVVIEKHGKICGLTAWLCQCDCGKQTVVIGSELTKNHTKSCGCLRREQTIERMTSHGERHSRLYEVWKAMRQRCINPSSRSYKRYGGRGITVCDEWNDYQVFRDWAMANGYDENAPNGQCTIDRIDNDKGYSPDNCQWVDMKVQANNRSNSKKSKKEKHYEHQ